MVLSLAQVFAVLASSATILCVVILMTVRRGKTLHPVYCAHCWVYHRKHTVVLFLEEQNRWAICPECTPSYWRFK